MNRLFRRTLLPSAVSIALHAGLVLLALGVTVTTIVPHDEGSPVLELELAPAAPDPQTRPQPTPTPPPAPRESAPDSTSPRRPAVSEQAERAEAAAALGAGVAAGDRPVWAAPSAPPTVPISSASSRPAATFAGLQSRAALEIVYVVDTSGSMVHTLSFVLDELARSVGRLQPTQSFQIVLFGDPPGEEGRSVRTIPVSTGDPALLRATRANRQDTLEWLETVVAGGRPDPLAGLRTALQLEPDAIFVLARGIHRTGVDTEPEVEAILAELERLNPVDPRTGRRPTVIKAVQFIEEDPTGLMQRIARAHGDGAGSYRLLRPEALAKDEPMPAGDATEASASLEPVIEAAREALAQVEADLSTHAVLHAIPTPDQVRRVREAAGRALDILADVPPATPRTEDGRAHLLRARAAALAAATAQRPALRLDLARRALADAQPLPIVDPVAASARDIIAGEARSLVGQPGRAHDDLLALVRYADEFGLDEFTLWRTRLALLTAADGADPASADAARARLAVERWLLQERADLPRRALAAAALARSLLATGDPDPLAPLLSLLEESISPPETRRAVLYPLIAAACEQVNDPPPAAVLAMAHNAAWEGERDRAVSLFRRVADSPADPGLRAEALRAGAMLLREAGDGDGASDLLLRLAAEQPGHPDARHALTLATEEASAERLAQALEIMPDHPLADRWRVAIAREARGRPGLDLLARVEPTPESRRLELELVDELLAGPGAGDAALLQQSARLAESLGRDDVGDRRLSLARSLLERDPARALGVLGDAESIEARVLQLRALLGAGREADAFTLAGELAKSREPALDGAFWEATTVWLELARDRGGQNEAVRAHLARLRRLDPALGGEPWASRLSALSE